MPADWTCALELRPDRSIAAGSERALVDALRRGADLRIYTEFIFEEHIVPGGDGDTSHDGLIREVIDFRQTYLVDDRHAAAVTTLRQPVHPPFGFNGTQPRTSFFLYNMTGHQGCANVILDGSAPTAQPGGRREMPTPAAMPKMGPETIFDEGTLGQSRNFIYDFDVYRFFVRDEWREVLSHNENGRVISGSFDALKKAQIEAREFKVAMRGLCTGMSGDTGLQHEVFAHIGSGFLHEKPGLYNAITHPLVRIAPAIPLQYRSGSWDAAWVYLATDGRAVVRRLDPYTRAWSDTPTRLACRWFVR
ncbi:MAG: hypothetical protein K8S99_04425 [Planctomycetes bacterium]|nr:hypothetical protein [Planctomycetota bacterium]